MSAASLGASAERVERTARAFARAVRELRDGAEELCHAAFAAGGASAASVAAADVGPKRLAAEVAGLLLALGLEDVLTADVARGARPMRDFAERWAARGEALPSSTIAPARRARQRSASPALPGQGLVRRGRSAVTQRRLPPELRPRSPLTPEDDGNA